MTLVALFFQTGSIPIWVPLAIILLIILLFWWGLTRNKIQDENEAAGNQMNDEGEAEAGEEPPAESVAVEADTADEPDAVAEEEEPSPAGAEPESPPEADDLKIIEGIGPKIADILADAGITTYAQLADTDPAQLEQIVRHDAGIKVANPTSWPKQAALAASGDWDGLEEFQNQLVAGRHRDQT